MKARLKTSTAIATLALGGLCGIASAADNGFYLGLGAARSDFRVDDALKSKDNGYKLIAGVRLLDSLGFEATYTDHGRASLPSGAVCPALVGAFCPDTLHLDASSTAAHAVGFLDFPLLDLFGKAGISSSRNRLRNPDLPDYRENNRKSGFAWGAGVQAHFGGLAVRAEYEQVPVMGNDKLATISLSLLYTFL